MTGRLESRLTNHIGVAGAFGAIGAIEGDVGAGNNEGGDIDVVVADAGRAVEGGLDPLVDFVGGVGQERCGLDDEALMERMGQELLSVSKRTLLLLLHLIL